MPNSPPPIEHTIRLARLRDRLRAYVRARPDPADPAGPIRQLAPYAQRSHRLNRLIKTLDARRLPTDLHAAIDEVLQTMEEEGFFDALDNPAPSPPPTDDPPASASPEYRGVDL